MKRILDLFIALIILTAMFSPSPFCANIYAQENSDAATQNNEETEEETEAEKLEEQEVRKFVDDFYVAFDETKDLKEVPDNFFIFDFKTSFAKNNKWFATFAEDTDLISQLSDDERYENNVLLANFISLSTISYFGNFDGDLDDFDGDILKFYRRRLLKR